MALELKIKNGVLSAVVGQSSKNIPQRGEHNNAAKQRLDNLNAFTANTICVN